MLISISGAMFFDMTYNEKRCLIEDVPTESQFTWKYSVQMYDELSERFIATSAGFGMHVTVLQKNDDYPILDKNYGSIGKFVYTTRKNGPHKVCLTSNSTNWYAQNLGREYGRLRIKLSKHIGVQAQDLVDSQDDAFFTYTDKDKVTNLQFETMKVKERNNQIERELTDHKRREKYFREISDDTNSAILFYALLQILTLLIMGTWQVYNLKNFFLSKKLV